MDRAKSSYSFMVKIAQVCPLWENVPPPKYGGTERVVYYLTEELVRAGHDVTLFACGTSRTSAELVSVYPRPLFRDGIPWTNIMYPLLNITEAFDRADEFDIIHVHLNKSSDYIALPLAKPIRDKVVFTFHFPYPTSQNRMDRHAVLQKYKDMNFTSISNSQRSGGENLNWIGTVYNGIDVSTYTYNPNPEDYVVWIGKFNPDKGVHEAIQAAKKAGVKLVLGGKIDQLEQEDAEYFKTQVEPYIDDTHVEYVGELDDAQKNTYFGGAKAFLNPIRWNEPFGLTMVESMACGTPVIAFNQGSASELIGDGNTGYLVHDVDEMAEKILEVSSIDRATCRARVEAKFSSQTMAKGYVGIYEKLLNT